MLSQEAVQWPQKKTDCVSDICLVSNRRKLPSGEHTLARSAPPAQPSADFLESSIFRQRRATYIDHLEGTVQELHDICIQLVNLSSSSSLGLHPSCADERRCNAHLQNSLFVSSHQESVELSAHDSNLTAPPLSRR